MGQGRKGKEREKRDKFIEGGRERERESYLCMERSIERALLINLSFSNADLSQDHHIHSVRERERERERERKRERESE